MFYTFLLAATLLALPLLPRPLPPYEPATSQPAVYLNVGDKGPATRDPEVAAMLDALVWGVASSAESMGLAVLSAGSSGYAISRKPVPNPTASLKLSLGLQSSPLKAAAGVETRFGGFGDAPWRLAYHVQRHVVGGMRDVLGYDVYDRGAVEEEAPPPDMRGLDPGHPWVEALPLFSTNTFEFGLIEQPYGRELLAASLTNAIAEYLGPSVRTPDRTARFGWRKRSAWQPLSPRVIFKGDDPTRLALTYDAGASSEPTPAILKALRDAGVRATIFLTADYVERNPDLVVQMARDGHEFGNHGSTHPDMTTVSSQTMIAELIRLENDVVALTGKSTRPWFRPPFGAYDERVIRVAGEMGYNSVMWTQDSADWRIDIDAATVEARILRYSTPGSIMIGHLGSPQSAQVLPRVLRVLQQRGISFGTLSEVVSAT